MAEPPSAHDPQTGDEQPEAQRVPAQRPPRRPLPSPFPVITATLGLFFVVLTLLAIQVRNGRDPALGPGPVVRTTGQLTSKGTQTKQATKIVTRTSPAAP